MSTHDGTMVSIPQFITEPNTTLAATTFTSFPRLATELQEMIWKQALPERRFVHVQHTSIVRGGVIHRFLGDNPDDYLFSNSPIPGMLHACRQARRIAMDAGWRLEFGKEDEGEGRIWFNLKKDVLYLPRPGTKNSRKQVKLERYLTDDQCLSIRRVAEDLGPNIFDSDGFINKLHNIEEYFVIIGHEGQRTLHITRYGIGICVNPDAARNLLQHGFSHQCWKLIAGIKNRFPSSAAPSGHQSSSRRPRPREWTFLKADFSENKDYHDWGFRFTGPDLAIGSRKASDTWFEGQEVRIQDAVRSMFRQYGKTSSVPRFRIGILVPDGRAPVVLKMREKHWASIQRSM